MLAESAGRLLERTSNRAPRGMTVHDRTRLIGQLHLFWNKINVAINQNIVLFDRSLKLVTFPSLLFLPISLKDLLSCKLPSIKVLSLLFIYGIPIYKEVSPSFSLSLCHINKNPVISLDLAIFFNYSGH